MTTPLSPVQEESVHEVAHNADAKALFGFWVYIMSDCLVFACFFATYAILHNSTFGGPSAKELFDLPFILIETLLLLTSTFTYGLVTLYAHRSNSVKKVLLWLAVTGVLGAGFLFLELGEFHRLTLSGNGPDRSAFLSSFFGLLSLHGLHVFIGLLWMLTLFIQTVKKGVSTVVLRKLSTLGLFWHFLDIIWIFIFTIVYLMGSLSV
jgi:cytochrome o ubiquinol oxidase subunit 3